MRPISGRPLTVKVISLVLALLILAAVSIGCIEGTRPIGWSGGVVSGNNLYVGSKEGRLVAVDIRDQSRVFSEPIRAAGGGGLGCIPAPGAGCDTGAVGVAIYGTPVVSGELVYLGGYNGKMYAFTTGNLQVRWLYPREGYLEPIVGGAAVGNNAVFFGNSDGKVYALDAATGDRLWEFQTGDKIWATPVVDDNTVYIGSFDNKLYALDAVTGNVRWEYETEGAIAATPLVHEGTVYIGSFDRHLYALNASTGALKWRFMGDNWFWATPLLIGDTVYAGSLDNKMYLLDEANGSKIAEFQLDSPISSSPVAVDNTVVIASQNGRVYFLNTLSREIRQITDIDKRIYGPISAHAGIVYIHTQDLTLHRINVENSAVMTSVSLERRD